MGIKSETTLICDICGDTDSGSNDNWTYWNKIFPSNHPRYLLLCPKCSCGIDKPIEKHQKQSSPRNMQNKRDHTDHGN